MAELAMRFAVGARVTVAVRDGDPIKLTMSPRVTVAQVVDVDGGPVYMVWHADEHAPGTEPYLYGPIAEDRLTPGWRW